MWCRYLAPSSQNLHPNRIRDHLQNCVSLRPPLPIHLLNHIRRCLPQYHCNRASACIYIRVSTLIQSTMGSSYRSTYIVVYTSLSMCLRAFFAVLERMMLKFAQISNFWGVYIYYIQTSSTILLSFVRYIHFLFFY